MKFFKIAAIVVVVILLAIAAFFFWAKSPTWKKSEYNLLYESDTRIAESQSDSLIDVVSYNIGYLSGMTNNTPQRPSREFYAENEARLIPALRTLNADIIGFQEIDYDSKRSYRTNQA